MSDVSAPKLFYKYLSNSRAQATKATKRASQNPSCFQHEAARPFKLDMIQFASAALSRYDGDGDSIVQRSICGAIVGDRDE